VVQVDATKCFDYAGELLENKELINLFEMEFRQFMAAGLDCWSKQCVL
jgi:hypothetical protein